MEFRYFTNSRLRVGLNGDREWENKVVLQRSVSYFKSLHATVLNQMGIDPNRLSYFYNGLNQKLVGVVPVEPIQKASSRAWSEAGVSLPISLSTCDRTQGGNTFLSPAMLQ